MTGPKLLRKEELIQEIAREHPDWLAPQVEEEFEHRHGETVHRLTVIKALARVRLEAIRRKRAGWPK